MPPVAPQTRAADVPEGAALLDVREDDEWRAGHVPGAVHVPMGQIPARLADLPDARPIYVICRSGARSDRVAQFLDASGREAVNVAGGMQAWSAAGRPMVSDGGGSAVVA